MSDTEYLNQDAFVCPECGERLPAFLLPETDDYGTPLDGTVVAWTEDGEPVRIAVGLGWDVQEREVSEEEIEASREVNPDGIFSCQRGGHYFDEPSPAEDAWRPSLRPGRSSISRSGPGGAAGISLARTRPVCCG